MFLLVSLSVVKLNKYKKIEGKPLDLCKKWSEDFKKSDMILDTNCDGTYLNFKINKIAVVKKLVQQVHEQNRNFGNTNEGNGKTAIIEFSSPNIAKPFHAGHLRSTIIGNFLQNLHRALGYKVISINYLGDWGKQYGLLALGFKKYGDEKLLKETPIRHLFDVYVNINKDKKDEEEASPSKTSATDDEARSYFKKMEDGDPEALSLWKKFRDLSIEEYKKIYARLNVKFDIYSGESQFGKEMEDEIKVLEQKKNF